MITNIPRSQFLRLHKICSDASDNSEMSDKFVNFLIKQVYDSSALVNCFIS